MHGRGEPNQGNARSIHGRVEEAVALLSIGPAVRPVVELDGRDDLRRVGIAEHEVETFLHEPVSSTALPRSALARQHIRKPHFRRNYVSVADGPAKRMIERRLARERMGKNFVEPPLEGLWWADDMQDFICGNRNKLIWRMMIVYEPDWLTAEMFDNAVAAAKARLGEPPAGLRLESHQEGLSAQIMYVGPNSAEAPTIARLHREFLPARKLIPNGHHHEIYLTDPNRVGRRRR